MYSQFKKIYYFRVFVLLVYLITVTAHASNMSKTFSLDEYQIRYPIQVKQLLKQTNPQEMWSNLSILTSYPDRSASHQSGVDATNWIKNQIDAMIKNNKRADAVVYTIATKGTDPFGDPVEYKQPSIVLKIGTANTPGVVIGAHMDTVTCNFEGCVNDPDGPLPGADDDGSGTVTVMEMARTLLSSDMQFKNPIYLVLYAAEEGDRLGSKAVVLDFQNRNIPVAAVMQLDMTGLSKNNDPTIWISSGGKMDKNLSAYALKLAAAYINNPAKMTQRNDESDHWSWSAAGYKTVFPTEKDCSDAECPRVEHTNKDTMDKLSLNHMTDYLKLALAFTVELAEPVLSK